MLGAPGQTFSAVDPCGSPTATRWPGSAGGPDLEIAAVGTHAACPGPLSNFDEERSEDGDSGCNYDGRYHRSGSISPRLRRSLFQTGIARQRRDTWH